jgi:NADPH2:quinone reductase
MKAIVMNSAGGCETLEYVERPDPVAGPGQALVEVAVAGVNFLDTGVRQGTLRTDVPNPKILGVGGIWRVLAVGEGVEPGQGVAWVSAPESYAERIAIPATSLVKVPDEIDDRTAALVMMQGLTASHFATDFYSVRRPHNIAPPADKLTPIMNMAIYEIVDGKIAAWRDDINFSHAKKLLGI